MRKSTVFLAIGLWLLALFNMWLVMRMGDEHARTVAQRIHTSPFNDQPQSGYTIVIVNAPPDTPTQMSGPLTRPTPRHSPR
jgi:hypothetical protein